jgi:hypothetical protein
MGSIQKALMDNRLVNKRSQPDGKVPTESHHGRSRRDLKSGRR